MNSRYGTHHELSFIKAMFAKAALTGNATPFREYAGLVLDGRRSYDGAGMDVNVKTIKNVLREMLAELDQPIPLPKTAVTQKEPITIE